MKKSRIAKFALLGASTAALAATLSTSTYAWYVSNKTATVTTSTGSTSSAESDGSISLSLSGQYGSFTKQITLGNFTTAALAPVNTTDGKTFKKLGTAAGATPVSSTYKANIDYYTTAAATTKVDTSTFTASTSVTSYFTKQAAAVDASVATVGYGGADSGDVFKYSFFILADGTYDGTSTVTINPTFNIANTTATENYKKQVNYSSLTVGTNASSGTEFYVNALNAMCFSGFKTATTTAYNSTNYEDGDAVTAALSGKNATALGLEALTTSTASKVVCSTTSLPNGVLVGTNYAQEYYEEITRTELTAAQKASASTSSFANFTILVGAPTLLEFYLYLDGASQKCFNACEQQSFAVDFSFTVAS